MLLPSTNITAKNFFANCNLKTTHFNRIIDIAIEDDFLGLTSDESTGSLTGVRILNSAKVIVFQSLLSGYSATVDVSSLPTGSYSVVVKTTKTTYSENIFIM